MKKQFLTIGLAASAVLVFGLTSCKKEECSECHYEMDGQEVELGERCDDAIADIEASGFAADGVTYEVHCGAH
jgi:hypothetical protein